MKTKTLLFFLAMLCTGWAWGQCPSRYYEFLDVNQVKARLSNSADMFWDLTSVPQYEVPVGSGKHIAFGSSIWMGGLDASGNLHVAAETYRQTGHDFFPGPYRSGGNYDCGTSYSPTNNPVQVLGVSNGEAWLIGSSGIEVFDPVTSNVQTITFPVFRDYARGLELADGRILIYGDPSNQNVEALYLIDPVTYTLTTSATLSNWNPYSSAIQLNNGQVLFAGIFGSELYDPVAGTATATAALNTGRVRAAVSLLPNGNVLLTGGSTNLSGGSALASIEVYDVTAGTWTTGPAMSINRRDHQMTTLNSGEICITGGNSTSGVVDHYDPVAGTITLAATIEPHFIEHTTALNNNGDVVITTKDVAEPAVNFFAYTPGQSLVKPGQIYGVGAMGDLMQSGLVFSGDPIGTFSMLNINTMKLEGQPWQNIWKINQSEIDQFLTDFQNNSVNFANYPVIENWPAHGNTSLGEEHYQAPFVDVDMDGIYDPANDGDYPCIEGDQALWWTFNDDAGAHTETGGSPLGVQVETMAFAYDCNQTNCPTTALDKATFYHYEIKNHSGQDYSQVYFGLWMDADLGNYSDDYVGCDTSRNLGYVYNGANNDTGPTGYGMNPPAMGTMVLNTPGAPQMTNYMYYENDFSTQGNPQAPEHYYDYMRSIWKDGTHLTYGGDGHGGTVNTNFMYSGDGGYCGGASSGWSEISELNQPFDRRFLQSFGPFDLPADTTVKFDMAVIYARGYYNQSLGSVCELQAAADSIQDWYSGTDHTCFNLVVDRQEPSVNELNVYPNPSSSSFNLELGEPLQIDAEVLVYDQIGRVVRRELWPAGSRKILLDSEGLSDGIYILGLKTEGKVITKKLLVQH